jgi:hypothetical protein
MKLYQSILEMDLLVVHSLYIRHVAYIHSLPCFVTLSLLWPLPSHHLFQQYFRTPKT